MNGGGASTSTVRVAARRRQIAAKPGDTESLVATRRVDDALFARLRGHFDEAQLIELTQLIGLYTGVAMMVALVQPALDAYAAPLPEAA